VADTSPVVVAIHFGARRDTFAVEMSCSNG